MSPDEQNVYGIIPGSRSGAMFGLCYTNQLKLRLINDDLSHGLGKFHSRASPADVTTSEP